MRRDKEYYYTIKEFPGFEGLAETYITLDDRRKSIFNTYYGIDFIDDLLEYRNAIKNKKNADDSFCRQKFVEKISLDGTYKHVYTALVADNFVDAAASDGKVVLRTRDHVPVVFCYDDDIEETIDNRFIIYWKYSNNNNNLDIKTNWKTLGLLNPHGIAYVKGGIAQTILPLRCAYQNSNKLNLEYHTDRLTVLHQGCLSKMYKNNELTKKEDFDLYTTEEDVNGKIKINTNWWEKVRTSPDQIPIRALKQFLDYFEKDTNAAKLLSNYANSLFSIADPANRPTEDELIKKIGPERIFREVFAYSESKTITQFRPGDKYGFLALPPDMGSYVTKPFVKLAEQPILGRDGKDFPDKFVASTIKISNEYSFQTAMLHRTLPEWHHRILRLNENLANAVKKYKQPFNDATERVAILNKMEGISASLHQFPYKRKSAEDKENLNDLTKTIGKCRDKLFEKFVTNGNEIGENKVNHNTVEKHALELWQTLNNDYFIGELHAYTSAGKDKKIDLNKGPYTLFEPDWSNIFDTLEISYRLLAETELKDTVYEEHAWPLINLLAARAPAIKLEPEVDSDRFLEKIYQLDLKNTPNKDLGKKVAEALDLTPQKAKQFINDYGMLDFDFFNDFKIALNDKPIKDPKIKKPSPFINKNADWTKHIEDFANDQATPEDMAKTTKNILGFVNTTLTNSPGPSSLFVALLDIFGPHISKTGMARDTKDMAKYTGFEAVKNKGKRKGVRLKKSTSKVVSKLKLHPVASVKCAISLLTLLKGSSLLKREQNAIFQYFINFDPKKFVKNWREYNSILSRNRNQTSYSEAVFKASNKTGAKCYKGTLLFLNITSTYVLWEGVKTEGKSAYEIAIARAHAFESLIGIGVASILFIDKIKNLGSLAKNAKIVGEGMGLFGVGLTAIIAYKAYYKELDSKYRDNEDLIIYGLDLASSGICGVGFMLALFIGANPISSTLMAISALITVVTMYWVYRGRAWLHTNSGVLIIDYAQKLLEEGDQKYITRYEKMEGDHFKTIWEKIQIIDKVWNQVEDEENPDSINWGRCNWKAIVPLFLSGLSDQEIEDVTTMGVKYKHKHADDYDPYRPNWVPPETILNPLLHPAKFNSSQLINDDRTYWTKDKILRLFIYLNKNSNDDAQEIVGDTSKKNSFYSELLVKGEYKPPKWQGFYDQYTDKSEYTDFPTKEVQSLPMHSGDLRKTNK